MDNDSRMFTVAGLLTRENGDDLSVAVRRVDVNRDGGPHAISATPVELDNVELRYSRKLGPGKFSGGVGYLDPVIGGNSSSRVHAFVTWQQGF